MKGSKRFELKRRDLTFLNIYLIIFNDEKLSGIITTSIIPTPSTMHVHVHALFGSSVAVVGLVGAPIGECGEGTGGGPVIRGVGGGDEAAGPGGHVTVGVVGGVRLD